MILIRRQQAQPTLDQMFINLRTRMGLFLIGAGASAGLSPLGRDFWRDAPLDYLRNQAALPAKITQRNLLTRRMIENSRIEIRDLFPGREHRPGTEDYPINDILKRLPNSFARERLKHILARARYLATADGNIPESYQVFRAFYPSIIADYNHDGLARAFCGNQHEITEMHGAISPSYGSPRLSEWLSILREFDFELPPDNLIMGLPESWTDVNLYRRISDVMSKSPKYVTIIGYSFAKIGNTYDDAVSLACFVQKFKYYPGAIFVIGPDSTNLCEMLSDELEINSIFPIKCYWNVLAHAFFETKRNQSKFQSLEQTYRFFYDQYGSDNAFSISGPSIK